MARVKTGKTRSEITQDYQERIRTQGLARVTVWVPASRREDMLSYASKVRHEDGVLLPYEAKRKERENESAVRQTAPSGTKDPPKKLSRKQHKKEKTKKGLLQPRSRLPLLIEQGMLPGLPRGDA